MDEEALTALQQQSVDVLAAAVSGNLKTVLSPEAAAVLTAVPALCDEVRGLREALEGVCSQFGHEFEQDGRRYLSTLAFRDLQAAFAVLGWDDPHPLPDHSS